MFSDNLSVCSVNSGHIPAHGFTGVDGNDPGVNGSAKALPPIIHQQTNNLVGVQSKFRRKYYHKVLLTLLILLSILLLIIIIILSVFLHKQSINSRICRSKECLRAAASLIYSMDEKTDPCEDFYQFTCGRWADEHPRPDSVTSNDWFREAQAKITRQLRKFLRQNRTDSEPEAVGKAKLMFKGCMDTKLLDERDMEPLVYYLKQFQLPLIPKGFNLSLEIEDSGRDREFNWLESLVSIKKYLGMDLIIGFDILPDPLNRTIKRIAFGTPEVDTALPFNNDDAHKILHKIRRKTIFFETDNDDVENRDEDVEAASKQTSTGLEAYIVYIKKIMNIYVSYFNPDVDSDEIHQQATAITLNAIMVARKIYKLKDAVENSTKSSKNPIDDIVYVTVNELQNQTDKLIAPRTLPIWHNYLQWMMINDNNINRFNVSQLQIITSQADIEYLQTIVEYLVSIPIEHLEFYIWLSAVEELILHTTSEMRLLHAEYLSVIIGTESSLPRSLYCTHGVNSLMGMAVSYALADDDFTRHKLPNVRRMLENIRQAFNDLVRSTSWMDEPTKRETLKKSAGMQSFIGYPDWITNATALNAYYEGITANASTHLENMIGVLRWQMQIMLENFNQPETFHWATSPSNVNAFHIFQANAISKALNYGSIGTILGHELTHGFDDSGRMFDTNGNMLQWWSNETINEYINRTECFVEQYNRYYLPDIDEYINGDLTLGENIADNGGMREAYYAYKLHIKSNGRELMELPGLERYTHEQLFFISFGSLWCESYTKAASQYAIEDSHCPGKIRLKGVLTNSMEFARTFQCSKGTTMNPYEPKCRIW
uniref:Peptidase M13 N-terminal domain-containing protein n=1 Tax=Glossina brevipalpis TaxID=37001 RepID=A0A1A9VZB7_9MUSC